MIEDFKRNFMAPRRDWNVAGPKIPRWFRKGLKKIDKKLVMQFFPPTYFHPDGTDPNQYPYGAWVITRRMRRTGWMMLHKRWTWSLTDNNGFFRYPTRADLRIIRIARGLWKRDQLGKLDSEFDRMIRETQRASAAESRVKLIERIRRRMRTSGMSGGSARNRIVVPS